MEQMLKITMGDKVVIVKNPEMGDIENAMQIAGNRPGVNQYLFGLLLAKELCKICIREINGKALKAVDLEQIEKHLTAADIMVLGSKLQEAMNMGAAPTDVKIEVLGSGGK